MNAGNLIHLILGVVFLVIVLEKTWILVASKNPSPYFHSYASIAPDYSYPTIAPFPPWFHWEKIPIANSSNVIPSVSHQNQLYFSHSHRIHSPTLDTFPWRNPLLSPAAIIRLSTFSLLNVFVCWFREIKRKIPFEIDYKSVNCIWSKKY